MDPPKLELVEVPLLSDAVDGATAENNED